MLKLGIESGDQHLLDRLDKGASVDMARCPPEPEKGWHCNLCVPTLRHTGRDRRCCAKDPRFTVQHSDTIDFLNLAIFNMPIWENAAGQNEGVL